MIIMRFTLKNGDVLITLVLEGDFNYHEAILMSTTLVHVNCTDRSRLINSDAN